MQAKLHHQSRIAILAITLFLLFDFAALALNIWLSREIEEQAIAINLAGRQRMLSQRMTKALLQIDHARLVGVDPTPHLDELKLTQRLFDETLKGFAYGSETRGGDEKPIFLRAVTQPEARLLIRRAEAVWAPYHDLIQAVLASDPKQLDVPLAQALEYGAAHNLTLLDHMNRLTTELESLTQREAEQIRWFQGAAFVLALLNFFGAFALYMHRLRVISRSHGLLDSIIDKVQTCVLVVSQDQRVVKANRMASQLFDYPVDALPGKRLNELLHQEGDEYRGVRTDGHQFPAEVEDSEVFMDDATVRIVTVKDITQQRETEQHLSNLAYHDTLTQLPNRLLFDDRLRKEISRAQRNGYKLGVLFIDLDRFKPINDTYGHEVGDEVLKEVAKRLRSRVREADTVARRGGDEFTVIITELHDLEASRQIADNILESMVAPMHLGQQVLQLGASIGISVYPDHGIDAPTLIKHADEAMYAVKAAGRNSWQVYEQG